MSETTDHLVAPETTAPEVDLQAVLEESNVDEVLAELDRRETDSEIFIRPQERQADIVVSFCPNDERDQGHLDAEVILRPTLQHPDMTQFIGDGGGITLTEVDGDELLRIPGDLDPTLAGEIEGAIWQGMQFATHLRAERLGEFTIGTELCRSESLALVQLLILYHLVTAKTSVALGATGARATEPAVAG